MKSRSLTKLCSAAVLLVLCWVSLPASWADTGYQNHLARTKPAEKCVPKHPYAAPDQPDCYRYLP